MDCVAGCKLFSNGDRLHHKDCPNYDESLSKMLAKLEADKAKLLDVVKEVVDYLDRNDLNSIRPTSVFHKMFNQLIQEMEEVKC